MSWDFNHRTVMRELADIIEDIVGTRLAYADNTRTDRAIIIGVDGLKPRTPYVQLTYNGTNDSNSWIIDSGIVEVTADTPVGTITYETSYTDTIVNFSVTVTAVSNPKITEVTDNYDQSNAEGLLRDIRKGLLLRKHRDRLQQNAYTVVHLGNNQIKPTPDILAGQTHERFSMTLKMSSVDRNIDYDSGVFDTAIWEGRLHQIDDTDPNPLVVNEQASSAQTP